MTTLLICLTIQGIMGAFDTLYHHEFTERLPWRHASRQELLIHSVRNLLYVVIFLSFGWLAWHGMLAYLFAAIFIIEILLTLWDFVIEDRTRHLPETERITHTLLAINFGIILALFLPIIIHQASLSTAFVLVYHDVFSWIMSLFALGAGIWCLRDLFSARAMRRPAPKCHIKLQKKGQRFLITGGSGFIGSALSQALIDDGQVVTILTRNKSRAAEKLSGPITFIDDLNQASGPYDGIINLAGEPLINGRWSAAKKQRIRRSRIDTTQHVIDYLRRTPHKPKVLINGSAIGYYGTSEALTFSEDSAPSVPPGVPPGEHDFAHNLCHAWEQCAHQAQEMGVRTVCLRIGIVLGTDGGALGQMLFPFEFGLGGKMGSGRQTMSWVHRQDLISLIGHVFEHDQISGPINAVSPHSVSNQQFSKALGKALHRPAFLPLPGFVLKILLGEMAETLLLKGQNVVPTKAIETGFRFAYPTLDQALSHLIRRHSHGPPSLQASSGQEDGHSAHPDQSAA